MGGIILYIFTLVLELISVLVRFGVVAGLAGLIFGREAGLIAGAVAGLYPVLYSLAALAGLPSGHLLHRLESRGRELTPDERARLDVALAGPRAQGVPVPRHIFAVDREGLNAFIAGRTMYIYRELFEHAGLAGVVAHELGHHNSLDGRLSAAIFGLTLPGGFLITYMLLGVLQWVAYGAFMLMLGLFVAVFLLMGLNVWGFLRSLFGISVTVARFTIIFAVGGVGTALLRSLWRSYFVEREYAADAYAARLGHAHSLIHFFEREVLSDVSVPWYTQPTHPPTTRRIAALERLAGSGHVHRTSVNEATKPSFTRSQAPVLAVTSPAARPHAAKLPATTVPAWLLPLTVVTGVIGVVLLALALLSGDPAPPARTPPTSPTPTLGVPGGG